MARPQALGHAQEARIISTLASCAAYANVPLNDLCFRTTASPPIPNPIQKYTERWNSWREGRGARHTDCLCPSSPISSPPYASIENLPVLASFARSTSDSTYSSWAGGGEDTAGSGGRISCVCGVRSTVGSSHSFGDNPPNTTTSVAPGTQGSAMESTKRACTVSGAEFVSANSTRNPLDVRSKNMVPPVKR